MTTTLMEPGRTETPAVGSPPGVLPTQDELARLPLRALVAFAARCARRVEAALREHDRAVVGEALALAERFAAGAEIAAAEAAAAASRVGVSAYEASCEGHHLADAEADGRQAFKASAAATSAAHAASAAAKAASGAGPEAGAAVSAAAHSAARSANHVDPSVAAAASADFRALLGLRLGEHPELGAAIDPDACGPFLS